MNHEQIFSEIYKNKNWATDTTRNLEFNSGDGSSIEYNKEYIGFLKNFIVTNNIKSVVDIGCGDWRCGEAIYKNVDVSYTGYDIYDTMVQRHSTTYTNPSWNFKALNCAKHFDEAVGGELLIIKDVLQHWTDSEIKNALDYFTSSRKYRYILITNCSYVTNKNINVAGDFRTLPIDYPILQGYPLKEVLKYNSKTVSLIECALKIDQS
jgi:hypothetical protein